MLLTLAPMRLSKRLNEKGRKTNRGISDERIQKETYLYRNIMDMGDGADVVTSDLKEDIIKLS